jgi:hypothetical protein
MTERAAAPEYLRSARDLFLVAMAIFVVTIAIGILNGADVVTFNDDQILTHVHSGTVGWLTLSIVASAFLLFRAADRRLMLTLAVLVPVYVLAFYTGNLPFRAIAGGLLLIAISWLLVWLWREFLAGERSLPRLAVTLGLTAFGYGAVVGVLLQVQFATGNPIVPGDGIGAHASAMTFGYLVLVAMGLMEWRLLGTRDMPKAGLVQVLALFLGGFVISFALLSGNEQAGGGIYLLTQLVAVVLFAARIWPRALRVGWASADPVRHVAAASIWVVGALVLFMYLVFSFISNPGDPDAFPLNVLIASDHAAYLGVLTNIALALLLALTAEAGRIRGAIEHLIFWGVNLGLVVFVGGLIVDTAELKRIGAPVMGIALLIALGAIAARAIGSRLSDAERELEPTRA